MKRHPQPTVALDVSRFDAAIFDMDGVITQTATVHAAAWKRLFDEYLEHRRTLGLPPFEPFDIDADYRMYVDGRPRYDGVQAFLASRGICIPYGSPNDSVEETICGLGNRKDAFFWQRVHEHGIQAYDSTVTLIRQLRAARLKTGTFSASRNAAAILAAASALELFDDRVDGVVADELALQGKPDPAMLLELCRRLEVVPSRTVVFEDAIAGVEAGRAGGFGHVIGVNRTGLRGVLVAHGADVEVTDLAYVTASSLLSHRDG